MKSTVVTCLTFASPLPLSSRSVTTHRSTSSCPSVVQTPCARLVHVSVPLVIEAPPKLCHTLFSDLSLMPVWSNTLGSVKRDPNDSIYSEWSFTWAGVTLSWRAVDLKADDLQIKWKAITGLLHTGMVTFQQIEKSHTRINMIVDYDMVDVLARVLQSKLVGDWIEKAIEQDLRNFRRFVLTEQRKRRTADKITGNTNN